MEKREYKLKNTILISLLCGISYLAVYIAKNTLSANSPQMIKEGVLTTAQVGTLSTVYFLCYGVGQLLNGIIGERLKAKYLVSFGLLVAGVCCSSFLFFGGNMLLLFVLYGIMGFALSTVYSPLVKVLSENVPVEQSTRCSLSFTFASFFGSPAAGAIATAFDWKKSFIFCSCAIAFTGVLVFASLIFFEKKDIVRYNQFKRQETANKDGAVKVLVKNKIIKFTFVAMLTGIVRTSVIFWLPTFFSQYLNLSPQKSALVFSIATFIISFSPFLTVFFYEKIGYRMNLTVLIGFALSAVAFLASYFLGKSVINIGVTVIAIMASNMADSMLWNRYCFSLRNTGLISTATGFLDFVSYMAAALSSKLFANAVYSIGWGKLILVWCILMVFGVIVSLFDLKDKPHKIEFE